MTNRFAPPFVAVDIGNTNLKFGLFQGDGAKAKPLPLPQSTTSLSPGGLVELVSWLGPTPPHQVSWLIGSVQRAFCTRLLDWLRDHGAADRITLLTSRDLPLKYELPRPDMAGIDRLLGAVAANELRVKNRPAVVVDLGTAITVDWVTTAGAFGGGAILPGIGMSARALHEFTDLLPKIEMEELSEPPLPLGTQTEAAMHAGLFWGAIGGVKELLMRMGTISGKSGEPGLPVPQVFLTGGAAPSVAHLLTADAIYVPHLVLQGIAVTAGMRMKDEG
jgi:type III pantothenate kinase